MSFGLCCSPYALVPPPLYLGGHESSLHPCNTLNPSRPAPTSPPPSPLPRPAPPARVYNLNRQGLVVHCTLFYLMVSSFVVALSCAKLSTPTLAHVCMNGWVPGNTLSPSIVATNSLDKPLSSTSARPCSDLSSLLGPLVFARTHYSLLTTTSPCRLLRPPPDFIELEPLAMPPLAAGRIAGGLSNTHSLKHPMSTINTLGNTLVNTPSSTLSPTLSPNTLFNTLLSRPTLFSTPSRILQHSLQYPIVFARTHYYWFTIPSTHCPPPTPPLTLSNSLALLPLAAALIAGGLPNAPWRWGGRCRS